MRPLIVFLIAASATGCRPATKTVKIGWDPPRISPDGYRVFVDDDRVLDIPPPPLDSSCGCLRVEITVPARGRHVVNVMAYTRDGGTSPSASVVIE
jgi:hypothetical protein